MGVEIDIFHEVIIGQTHKPDDRRLCNSGETHEGLIMNTGSGLVKVWKLIQVKLHLVQSFLFLFRPLIYPYIYLEGVGSGVNIRGRVVSSHVPSPESPKKGNLCRPLKGSKKLQSPGI